MRASDTDAPRLDTPRLDSKLGRVICGPTHLTAIAVGHPIIGPEIAKKILDYLLGPRELSDEDSTIAMMENPQQPVRIIDPEASFVRLQGCSG
jgi:hypothetical protein